MHLYCLKRKLYILNIGKIEGEKTTMVKEKKKGKTKLQKFPLKNNSKIGSKISDDCSEKFHANELAYIDHFYVFFTKLNRMN